MKLVIKDEYGVALSVVENVSIPPDVGMMVHTQHGTFKIDRISFDYKKDQIYCYSEKYILKDTLQ